MTSVPDSIIVVLIGRLLSRLIQIFAFYVIFHGHYSPGGGFQGGTLLAASIVLHRMAGGAQPSQQHFPAPLSIPLSAVGALIFWLVGFAAMAFGSGYLNHGELPFPWERAEVRSFGILLVELGVALAVMATLVSIFDNLTEERHG